MVVPPTTMSLAVAAIVAATFLDSNMDDVNLTMQRLGLVYPNQLSVRPWTDTEPDFLKGTFSKNSSVSTNCPLINPDAI